MAPILYTGLTLDRAPALRRDTEWLPQLRKSQRSRLLPLWRGHSAVTAGPTAAWLPADAVAADAVFLGLSGDVAWFAAEIPGTGEEPPDLGPGIAFRPLREVGALLPQAEAALLATARAMLHWHSRARYCGTCGGVTESAHGGARRHCPGCGAEHFPRTDPAVIMLVEDGERCLLSRQPHWRPGMWALLAGFVEPGESLEEAVAREVLEETGIIIESPRYVASQPWPFPSSLMIAFAARAAGGSLRIDHTELEDAAWFTRAEIRARDGTFLPGKDSVARWLIEQWLMS